MNWFKKAQIEERFSLPYRRVKAQDYMRLMRLIDKKPVGLPATSDMNRLLDKMISDLEDAVSNVYMNTIAMGHTPNSMMYPCPDCGKPINTLDDIWDVWENNAMMMHYWDVDKYLESDDYYGEDPENLSEEIKDAFERADGDGIYICEQCGLIRTFDEVADKMNNPSWESHGGRDTLLSDQIDHIVNYLKKIKEADTFERKFPYFEGIIEWVHGSGEMSHWFLEGGEHTINKYRNSKLPPQHDGSQFQSWVHPHNRDKDWDWSSI